MSGSRTLKSLDMFTPKKAVSCLEIPHDIHDMPARAALSGTKCSSEIAVKRSNVNTFKKKFFEGPPHLQDNPVKKRAYFYVRRSFSQKALVRANGKLGKIFLQKQKVDENISCAKGDKERPHGPGEAPARG